MIRAPSLNDRIMSLTSLEEVEGYLLGIAMTGREVFPLEEELLGRRIASLDVSGSRAAPAGQPSRPSLDPDALKVKLRALAAKNRRGA
jgi:hypothetical protein